MFRVRFLGQPGSSNKGHLWNPLPCPVESGKAGGVLKCIRDVRYLLLNRNNGLFQLAHTLLKSIDSEGSYNIGINLNDHSAVNFLKLRIDLLCSYCSICLVVLQSPVGYFVRVGMDELAKVVPPGLPWEHQERFFAPHTR